MKLCKVEGNGGHGIESLSGSSLELGKCSFTRNTLAVIRKEPRCPITSSGNTATVAELPTRGIPGFKLTCLNSCTR